MPEPDKEFVHLHLHTDYSLLDGACRVDRLMQRAGELGMKALAMTDHGNMFGAVDFYTAARKHGIKPILGCEVYLVDHSRLERDGKSKYFHKGLLARNFKGYQNLLKIISDAHVNGFYYKPRTDLEQLAAHSEGLIGFTGCLQGMIPQHILHGRMDEARAAVGRFVEIFGRENYFVEIMDHGIDEQLSIIRPLLDLAREFDLKTVCTNDVHYVHGDDCTTHDALLCIQTGSKIDDEKRMRYPSNEFYLKSGREMEEKFREVPEALTNTLSVAEMCEMELPLGENHYPVFELPPDDERPVELRSAATNADFLRQLCLAGLRERYGIDPAAPEKASDPELAKTLLERIDYELGVIEKTGFIDYFLIVWDFIDWARQQGIPVGPGRGSGAGCLVAYLLKITDIDPLRFKLLFERFLNPERVSPPDFDIDFCMRRRGAVIDYVREKYGKECVANIVTFGKFGAKMVVRDVARVLGIPYADADRIAKMVPDDLNISLDDALAKSAELRTEVDSNPQARRIMEHGRIIEGMVRNVGTHAAGVIIADRPLSDFVPLTLQEGAITTQFPKGPVEDLGLLKMDFLGLKTLTVIDDAVRNIHRTVDPDFDIEKVPFEDTKTFELLNQGKTVGVFQMESGGMQSLCRQFNIASIDEIIALIALYRPGPMDWIPDYIRGKNDPSTIKYPHSLLEETCSETYGVMVYQEQVMEAARIVAGYSLGGADILRRAMGKKKVEEMEKQRAVFVKGAKDKHDIDEKTALEIFAILEKFAGYGFNKSHSAAYAFLSYRTGYLKANYPVQFMAALLSSELGNADKVRHFIDECANVGIQVLGPDVNQSRHDFTPVLQNTNPVATDFTSGDASRSESATQIRPSSTSPRPHSPSPPLPESSPTPPIQNPNSKIQNSHSPSDANFNISTSDFSLQSSIRFGLAAIKGVGDSAAQKIIEEREANGPFENFEDFVNRVDSRAVNRRVLECLIRSGAFDFTGINRGLLLADLDAVLNQAAALQRDRAAGQESFLDLLGPTDASPTQPNQNPNSEIQNSSSDPAAFSPAEMLKHERELLGFYVSGHPMDDFGDLAIAAQTHTEETLLQSPDRTHFRLCGVVSNIVRKLSRKDNRPWAFFNLLTRDSTYQLNLYANSYEEHGAKLEEEKAVIVHGTLMNRDGDEPRLVCNEITSLRNTLPGLINKISWILDPAGDTEDFLQQLRDTIDKAQGDTVLNIGFLVDSDHVALAETAGSLSWRVDPKTYTALRRHPAVAGTLIETTPPQPPEPFWKRRK